MDGQRGRIEEYDSDTTETDTQQSPNPPFLFPPSVPRSGHSSACSSATSTPIPSRSGSPLPQFLITGPSYSSLSESDSDEREPFPTLIRTRNSSWRDERRKWWQLPRQGRRRDFKLWRFVRRWFRRIIRHPFVPKSPLTIILSLILLSLFAISLTLLLMYILNPDKDPLPWRAYCSTPYLNNPPDPHNPHLYTDPYHNYSVGSQMPPFPHETLDLLPPVGLFVGVFSTDSSFQRRALARSTWASHPRSRDGAGDGDSGNGTSRTVVRFILGQPRKDYERSIRLEMEEYNDIVILPMSENMNGGKTHTYFSWASINAWVPPVYTHTSSQEPMPHFSYSNASSPPPPLAWHDPVLARHDSASDQPKNWVRPDYVVKVDDDAFLMLAELEARLRLELHAKPQASADAHAGNFNPNVFYSDGNSTQPDLSLSPSRTGLHPSGTDHSALSDPLIYWGYLVTNRLHRFMAGELYALSWSLVDWVARDPRLKDMTRGAEDKQTARWMKVHPQAEKVRWVSERCWIYDHPRAGTVYTHGFLFPSEVTRVRQSMAKEIEPLQAPPESDDTLNLGVLGIAGSPTPASWAHSSVSTFHVRYTPPLEDLDTKQSVEALVEGSEMSLLRPASSSSISDIISLNPNTSSNSRERKMSKDNAWALREGRKKKYEGKRVGGTVVVHFIKQNMWFLETAVALLEGEEETERERSERLLGEREEAEEKEYIELTRREGTS